MLVQKRNEFIKTDKPSQDEVNKSADNEDNNVSGGGSLKPGEVVKLDS